MLRLRVIYVASMVALVGLLALTVVRPTVLGRGSTEVLRQQLQQTDDEWVMQFDLSNQEGRQVTYRIEVSVLGQSYADKVSLADGQGYTYRHHVAKAGVDQAEARVAVYREGESSPTSQTSYLLRKAQ